jgi:predicted 2-oxoglutarate/Fe(II)-dependent dioxygenase YbiX
MLLSNLTPAFSPLAEDTCFCKSNNQFSDCCGSTSENRPPPHGVLVVEHALSEKQCTGIVSFVNRQPKTRSIILEKNPLTGKMEEQEISARKTKGVNLGNKQERFDKIVKKLLLRHIQPAFDCSLEWFERPDILCYTKGGYYGKHADSENLNRECFQFEKMVDRDISILVYLNDNFEGGGLEFSNFNYVHQPKTGDLVAFPSDNRYIHQALTVASGTRYAMVSWAAIEGVNRVHLAPPDTAILMTAD